MGYKALYRTYRPEGFNEMAGQQHIVKTLKNAIDMNQIAHAYLFCGPRGTGKTSTAKIFAKAINCETDKMKPCGVCDNCIAAQKGVHQDIIEIDAASNNGVEEVRNLIEKVKYAPSQGKYKIYIIDEVHMMSAGAFNALLKTIEEPPAHVIFILATTEPHKVLPTIISRCQRYDFSKVSKKEMIQRMKIIIEEEQIKVEDKVLENIAILADGGMRDALSILDQCRAYAPELITLEDVNEIYGIVSIQEVCDIIESSKKHNTATLIAKIEQLDALGTDIKRLTMDLIEALKESVVYDYTKSTALLKILNVDQVTKMIANTTSKQRLEMIDILMDTYERYRQASNIISYFEIGMLKIMDLIGSTYVQNNEKEITNEKANKDNDLAAEKEYVPYEDDFVIEKEMVEIEELTTTLKQPTEEVTLSVVEKEDKGLSNDLVLQLLVGANKPEKISDNEKLDALELYLYDLDKAKYANLLKNGTIIASSEKYIVYCVESLAKANEINESDKDSGLITFIETILGKKKKIFALTPYQRDEVIELFKERSKENTLPEAYVMDLKEEEIKDVKDIQEEKLKSLFDDLEIKED